MKTILTLPFLVCLILSGCATKSPPSTGRFFAHPGAHIVATWKNSECTADLTQTRNPIVDPEHLGVSFRGGCGHNDDGLFWEFVHKTEHGDVYLIKRGRPVEGQTIIPVLYRGQELTVIATEDLKVQILQGHPRTRNE